jgi:predicted RNA-binding protein with PIN domain
MPYIIDGHNLIGALPTISIRDPEDERLLIDMLQTFLSRARKKGVVYFDRRAPGAEASRRTPNLQIRFVSRPQRADDAIRAHIQRLGREAPNWTVVSSDRELIALALRAGARSMHSQQFATLLSPSHAGETDAEKPSRPRSQEEIEAWEALFSRDPED